MIVLELNEIEIDHCLVCGGIWLDAGELELLLEDAREKDIVLNSFEVNTKTAEVRRKCPICLKKMEKVLYGKEKGVLVDKTPPSKVSGGSTCARLCPQGYEGILVDKCRSNDGIWFDRGELDEIIEMGSLDKSDKILTMLKDMFGKFNNIR